MNIAPIVIGTCLLLSGCASPFHRIHTPSPLTVTATPGPSAERVDRLSQASQSKAAAATRAAQKANEQSTDSAPKTVVAGELSVVAANLPEPRAEDLVIALDRANAGLRGDLKTAQAGWNSAQSEAVQLRTQLSQAQLDATKEREQSAAVQNAREAQWKATFDKLQKEADERVRLAQEKAEQEQRHMLNWIFHGAGAVLVLLGVLCFTLFSSLPFAGPKVGMSLIAAGAASISAGIAVNWVLSHPWIMVIIIGVPLIGAAVLAYANHWHGTSVPKTA